MKTLPCGHPRTHENTLTSERCRICAGPGRDGQQGRPRMSDDIGAPIGTEEFVSRIKSQREASAELRDAILREAQR